MPIFYGAVSIPGGITTVQPSSATNLTLLGSTVDGIVKSVNGDGTVQIQTTGLLTLTTAQWDAITGDVGGLVLGTRYYLAPFPAFASLTGTFPTLPALFVTQVGIGINPTTMQLSLPGITEQNLENLTVVAGFSGPLPPLGSVLIITGNHHAALATSDISLTDAQAVGVAAAVDNVNGTALIVQLAGVATLTTAEWDAVTDTVPGMVAGTAYYVDINARAGNLTAIKPVIGAVTQVGVGLSTTEMILNPPFPLRLP